jgi:hypothetical protein
MKNIKDCFEGMQDITPYLKGETQIDEGLRDILNTVKAKFQQAWSYLKGIVTKIGTYFLPTNDKGEIMPAISPLTAGQAYVDGAINKNSTFVKLDNKGAKITGCKTKYDDALELKGSDNSFAYWDACLNECNDDEYEVLTESALTVNEVKLHTEDPEAKYNIIVDDDELKMEIKMCLEDRNQARMLIWGAPGIGKTAILMNVLEEMKKDFPDYRLIVKTLSNETPDNFTLPKYVEIDGQDFATDVPKTWLPVYKPTGNPAEDKKLSDACGNGLLFVDELSRATPQVLNVVLPLVNEGIFNGYKLGDGWTIICASNRSEDEASGQSTIGNALANRFVQFHYEPTVHTWRKWADKQGFISPLLLQWLSMPESEEMSGGKFYYMDPNDDSGRLADTTLMCTPRSWTNAMKRLARYHHTGTIEGFKIFDIPDRIIRRALNGAIPAQAVDAFMAFLAVIEKIGNFDQAVYDVWNNGGKSTKIDKKHLSKVALPLAQLIVCAKADSLPTQKEWENLADWLVAQKSDQLASYVLDIFQNVFLADVPPTLRAQVFTIQERIRRANGDASKLNSFVTSFKPFCAKWGIKFENIPDYVGGLSKLIKAYGASFESAVIDAHKSALG